MNRYLKTKVREVIKDIKYKHRLYENTLTSIALLLEDFKSQKAKYINQGHDAAIVDQYLEYFRQIKNSKYKQASNVELPGVNVPTGSARYDIDRYKTFRELEIVVDYVRGQRDIKPTNFTVIETDGKPVYKNSNVEIYYADSPEACIKYKGDKPYSWCVAKPKLSGNMFYGYRFNRNEPAFYFVKRLKATKEEFKFWNDTATAFDGEFKDKYHFFVIQVIGSADIANKNAEQYIVTSAHNDGDKPMSWNQVLKVAPELKGLNKVFEPKPFTPEEREKNDRYQRRLSDQEYIALPYEDKKYYIDVNIGRHSLTDEQFKETPADLQNYYIGLGLGLTDKQFDVIKSNSKLVKRYREISYREYRDNLKNGGHGLERFTGSQKEVLREYLRTFTPNQMKEILDLHIENRAQLSDRLFEDLPYDLKIYYIKSGGYLSDDMSYKIYADSALTGLADVYEENAFLKFKEIIDLGGYDVYLNDRELRAARDHIKTLPIEEQIKLLSGFFIIKVTNPHMESEFELSEEERHLINTTELPGQLIKLGYLEIDGYTFSEFKSLNNLKVADTVYLRDLPILKTLGKLEEVEDLRISNLPQLKSLGRLKKVGTLHLDTLPNLRSLGSLTEADSILLYGTYLDENYTIEELEEMYPQLAGRIEIADEAEEMDFDER